MDIQKAGGSLKARLAAFTGAVRTAHRRLFLHTPTVTAAIHATAAATPAATAAGLSLEAAKTAVGPSAPLIAPMEQAGKRLSRVRQRFISFSSFLLRLSPQRRGSLPVRALFAGVVGHC